jgi:hypothetical protein
MACASGDKQHQPNTHSLTHTHAHSRTHSHSHKHTHTHTHTLTLTLTLTHTHSLTHTRAHSLTHTHTLTLTRTHTHTHAHTHTRAAGRTHCRSACPAPAACAGWSGDARGTRNGRAQLTARTLAASGGSSALCKNSACARRRRRETVRIIERVKSIIHCYYCLGTRAVLCVMIGRPLHPQTKRRFPLYSPPIWMHWPLTHSHANKRTGSPKSSFKICKHSWAANNKARKRQGDEINISPRPPSPPQQ